MKSIYFLLIGLLIGAEIALGVLVAPVIFYPQSIIGEGVLSHFQSGRLMSVVFVKFGYMLLTVSVFALLYELAGARKPLKFALKFSSFMLALINLALAAAFVFYFTPYVLSAQAAGEAATQTVEFARMHKASELVMKFMLFAQLFLFLLKFNAKTQDAA